jgi:hypothetical protein
MRLVAKTELGNNLTHEENQSTGTEKSQPAQRSNNHSWRKRPCRTYAEAVNTETGDQVPPEETSVESLDTHPTKRAQRRSNRLRTKNESIQEQDGAGNESLCTVESSRARTKRTKRSSEDNLRNGLALTETPT